MELGRVREKWKGKARHVLERKKERKWKEGSWRQSIVVAW
jgi:hypothetical protein